MQHHYDVVIVGGGGAGMSAALSASELGAKVLLLEADENLGGTTARSSGVYYAAGTSIQRSRGIEHDDSDAMYKDFYCVNQCRIEPSVVRTLCQQSAEGLEWLESNGVEFAAENLYQSCIGSAPRGHKADGDGLAISMALEHAVQNSTSITCVLRSQVIELRIGEQGECRGVIADDGSSVSASSVVLAVGGIGHSRALLQQYYPDALKHADWPWSISSPYCTGDAIRLGRQAGGVVQGHNSGVLSLTANFEKKLELGGRQGWPIYVNYEGRRFVDELLPDYYKSRAVQAQTGCACFALFDERTRLEFQPQKHTKGARSLYADNWTSNMLSELADIGKVKRSESVEELAVSCGIFSPRALSNTISNYNRDVADGRDSMFFKEPHSLRPLRLAPFYAVELRAAIVAVPHVGLRINNSAQVMSEDETAIPGLYAAGSAAGNVLGDQYLGGGISIANAIVYGRIAGSGAAIEASSRAS